MSDDGSKAVTTRRALLVAGGVAAASAATLAAAPAAEAANGGALLLGRSNTATASTGLAGSSVTPLMVVTNTGAGASAYFQSFNSNGFAGGTRSAASYGLSAANTASVAGKGAALAASGGVNTGAAVNTSGDLKYALNVRHVNLTDPSQPDVSGGAMVDGGVRDGVWGKSGGAFTTSGVVGGHYAGGAGVFGFGTVGVLAYSETGGGAALYATAVNTGCVGLSVTGTESGAEAVEVIGISRFKGDVYVDGTIFCNNAIAPLPVAPKSVAANRVQRRAVRTVSKITAK